MMTFGRLYITRSRNQFPSSSDGCRVEEVCKHQRGEATNFFFFFKLFHSFFNELKILLTCKNIIKLTLRKRIILGKIEFFLL